MDNHLCYFTLLDTVYELCHVPCTIYHLQNKGGGKRIRHRKKKFFKSKQS